MNAPKKKQQFFILSNLFARSLRKKIVVHLFLLKIYDTNNNPSRCIFEKKITVLMVKVEYCVNIGNNE